MAPPASRIVITGAGVGGLTLALLLRRQGLVAEVVEQAASWAASAALHLPDGPATRSRDAYLARLPEHLAWIHGHDVLAPGRAARLCAGAR